MEKIFIAEFILKPAANNKENDDYHFKIPREYIRLGIIDPEKMYELSLKEFKDNRIKEDIL